MWSHACAMVAPPSFEMHVPSTWTTQKRPKSARPKNDTTGRKKTRQAHEPAEPVSVHDLAQTISDSILESSHARAPLETTLNLNTILSGVAYREILQNLFGGSDAILDEVPVVCKAYEEAFMRESMLPCERPCVMGSECEGCFISKDHRFPCTEFLLPGEERAEPRMCVLCCRKHTQKMYYDLLYNPPAMHMGVIQRYGVVVGVRDEYAGSETLIMPANGPVHSMPFPSVAYCRANYTVVVRNAVRFVVQDKCLGFRTPSHGECLSAA